MSTPHGYETDVPEPLGPGRMWWAFVLAAVAVAAIVAGGVWAVTRSHDTPPRDIATCAVAKGAHRVRGEEGLAFAREDIRDGTLRPVRRYRLGDDRGVLLRGSGYRVLVVGTPRGPSLQGRDLPFRIYRRTATFAAVLSERDPTRDVLDACARRSAS
jgi:hypothetical protein